MVQAHKVLITFNNWVCDTIQMNHKNVVPQKDSRPLSSRNFIHLSCQNVSSNMYIKYSLYHCSIYPFLNIALQGGYESTRERAEEIYMNATWAGDL